MAMNKQRRTSNINNIVRYDTSGNVSLPAGLTVEGLDAGFVKSDANGLFSIDTAAYVTLSSLLTGYVVGANADIAATDTILQAFGKLQGQIDNIPSVNIYNSNGTLTGNRTISSGGFSLTINPSTTFTENITFNGNLIPNSSPSGPNYLLGITRGTASSNLIAYTNQGLTAMQSIAFSYFTTTFSSQDIVFSGGTTSSKYFGQTTGNWTIGGTTDAGYKLQVEGFIYATGNIYSAPTSNANGLLVVNGSSGSYGGNVSFQRGGTQDGVIGTQATNNTIITGATNADICILADGGGRAIRLSTTSASPQFTIKSSGVVNIANVPTSAAGLVSGDIYRTANVLNIVP
jgi:hypothetical protein